MGDQYAGEDLAIKDCTNPELLPTGVWPANSAALPLEVEDLSYAQSDSSRSEVPTDVVFDCCHALDFKNQDGRPLRYLGGMFVINAS